MSSQHNLWQARWGVDQHANLAIHDNGLRVRLQAVEGVAENAVDIALTLVPAHGENNAAAMVQCLVRKGAQLLIDPFSRGWRG